MTLNNNRDAGQLNQKDNQLSARERYYAEPMRDGYPSFFDYCHYNLFLVSGSGMGPVLEYRDTMEYLNVQGEDGKMPFFRGTFEATIRLSFAYFMLVAGQVLGMKFPPKFMWQDYESETE